MSDPMTTTPERDALALRVIDTARAAMNASKDYDDIIGVPDDLAASLSLALDEYDALAASPAAGGGPPLTDEQIIRIAETLGERVPGERDYESWGQGYRRDEDGQFTIPLIPHIAVLFARAVLAATPPAAAASTVPADGWKLVMVPDAEPSDEPDWEEVLHQSEMATGLKIERHAFSIVVREVRRWLAHRSSAAPAAASDEREAAIAFALDALDAISEMYRHNDSPPTKSANLFSAANRAFEAAVTLRGARAARAPQAAPQPTAQADAVTAAVARRMYAKWCDEQGIHSNRFPSWPELSDSERVQWLAKAQASASEGGRHV